MKSKLAAVAAALLTTACSTVGVRSGTEEPAFTEVERVGAVEIRTYGERIAAQTVVTGSSEAARNRGFQRLAGYIFGGNTARTSIAMTAPVAQAGEGPSQSIAMTAPVAQGAVGQDRWTIQFFMPSEYTMASLPVPRDPAVVLAVVPAETYAVLRFSGLGSARAVAEKEAELDAALTGSGWTSAGDPVVWFYDPPWTLPPLRRNEVAVRVTRQGR
ncbi:SOUL family heme-binding protein [Brevundimonas sp. UBA2416]|uniref:SOUL family heme-binding protein n=1 Tax=Brevundimonas sp. UBA2416 TaxID=1946124 RepID=UPI0025B96B34|nr:heme-binding protein [Brevundimonas sp. UBA2416]HRJ64255.1 heme-binding protein [Brevundimonas sp.]